MDLSRPARTLAPALQVEVAVTLAGTTLPLTGRQLHRLMAGRHSQRGVLNALNQLVDTGLVHQTEAGSANLYELNREHVAAGAVLALLDLRGQLFDRMRSALDTWTTPPVAAAVFGSAARGDGDVHSDVDVFVVRPVGIPAEDPDWVRDVAALNSSIRRWSGNAGSIIEATPRQVRAMVARDEPIVADLRTDQVVLRGGDVLDHRRVQR